MGTIASQITSLTIVYSIVYSGADQSKHQSSAPLAFLRGWWCHHDATLHAFRTLPHKAIHMMECISLLCMTYISLLWIYHQRATVLMLDENNKININVFASSIISADWQFNWVFFLLGSRLSGSVQYVTYGFSLCSHNLHFYMLSSLIYVYTLITWFHKITRRANVTGAFRRLCVFVDGSTHLSLCSI